MAVKPEAIGRILARRLAALGVDRKIREASVATIWAEVVGPQVAGHTHVTRTDGGRVFVAVDDPTWRQELSFRKKDLIDALNRTLGKTTVDDIHFGGPS